jgi:CDP-paratose 2-epimerase
VHSRALQVAREKGFGKGNFSDWVEKTGCSDGGCTMKPWNILLTEISGLIGSEAVEYFDRQVHQVVGVDNNMRWVFFGVPGDTLWNLERSKHAAKRLTPTALDIRDRDGVMALFHEHRFDLIVHCAAQPSHDKAADIALMGFEVNVLGTVNLLEATRLHCRDAAFVFMTTNKVYGNAPNEKPLLELETRFNFADPTDFDGIDENCRIDRTLLSLFGASKVASDEYTQEYGRYFGMNVGIFRGGCLTGPSHSGVELLGFLSNLLKVALSGGAQMIYGYKGKQVRDNLHSFDVVCAFEEFARNPRPGEVYNLGGGRDNSISILEAIARIEVLTSRKIQRTYKEQARRRDHICYVSSLAKFKSPYPGWSVTRSLDSILQEIVVAEREHGQIAEMKTELAAAASCMFQYGPRTDWY